MKRLITLCSIAIAAPLFLAGCSASQTASVDTTATPVASVEPQSKATTETTLTTEATATPMPSLSPKTDTTSLDSDLSVTTISDESFN